MNDAAAADLPLFPGYSSMYASWTANDIAFLASFLRAVLLFDIWGVHDGLSLKTGISISYSMSHIAHSAHAIVLLDEYADQILQII